MLRVRHSCSDLKAALGEGTAEGMFRPTSNQSSIVERLLAKHGNDVEVHPQPACHVWLVLALGQLNVLHPPHTTENLTGNAWQAEVGSDVPWLPAGHGVGHQAQCHAADSRQAAAPDQGVPGPQQLWALPPAHAPPQLLSWAFHLVGQLWEDLSCRSFRFPC